MVTLHATHEAETSNFKKNERKAQSAMSRYSILQKVHTGISINNVKIHLILTEFARIRSSKLGRITQQSQPGP